MLAATVAAVAFSQTALHAQQPAADPVRTSLATAFAALLEDAIPREYEKRKHWGDTTRVTYGWRNKGKGLRINLEPRKTEVNHGVWKHYKVRLVEPEKNLTVQLDNLRAVDAGRVAFTLTVAAKLDTWARTKVYRYGVHIIALEIVGDTEVQLTLDCEVGVNIGTDGGALTARIDPRVTAAELELNNFHLRRVSNARGPLVGELGEGIEKMIERELTGEKLTSKLNRAIDKKRDRLQVRLDQLTGTNWWPLSQLPAVQDAQLSTRRF